MKLQRFVENEFDLKLFINTEIAKSNVFEKSYNSMLIVIRIDKGSLP